MNKEKSMVSVILYLGDSPEESWTFLEKVCAEVESVFEHYEVVAVNDNRQKTADYVRARYRQSGMRAALTLVNLSVRQGVERAMNAGIDIAIGDYLYEFDNIHAGMPEGIVAQAFRRSTEGYDIVTTKPEGSEKGTSRLFYRVFNRFSHSGGKVGTDGMHLLSRRAVNRLHAINSYIPYRKAAYAACGMKMTNVSYTPVTPFRSVEDDRVGKAMDALILYTDAAYRLSLFIAFFMLAVALIAGIYTLVIYLSMKPVAGWTTTMVLSSAGFSGTFLLFAIVIKYLSLLVDLIFHNQKYLVASVDKVQNE